MFFSMGHLSGLAEGSRGGGSERDEFISRAGAWQSRVPEPPQPFQNTSRGLATVVRGPRPPTRGTHDSTRGDCGAKLILSPRPGRGQDTGVPRGREATRAALRRPEVNE